MIEGEEWSIRQLVDSMSVASLPDERLLARDRLTAIEYVRVLGIRHQDLVGAVMINSKCMLRTNLEFLVKKFFV